MRDNIKSDIELLIQFVLDQGWDSLDLVAAANRLGGDIKDGTFDNEIDALATKVFRAMTKLQET